MLEGPQAPPAAPDWDVMAALFLDESLTPAALRIAVLRALGMPEAQIRAKLGLPKRTCSDTIEILSRPRW